MSRVVMSKKWRNILILISPFLVMIIVNESMRLTHNMDGGHAYGVETMNSTIQSSTDCSWSCYYNTTYCKKHHVKHMNNYFQYIDGFYFWQIKFLHGFGNYTVANIVFMVILWPALMYFLLITFLNQRTRIKKLKRQN